MSGRRLNAQGAYWIMMDQAARQIFQGAIDQVGGNVPRAAAILGIDYTFMTKRLHYLGMTWEKNKRGKYKTKKRQLSADAQTQAQELPPDDRCDAPAAAPRDPDDADAGAGSGADLVPSGDSVSSDNRTSDAGLGDDLQSE